MGNDMNGFGVRPAIIGSSLAVLLLFLAGCGGKEPETSVSSAEGTAQEAVDDPYRPGAPLPPNHPPIDMVDASQGEMPVDHPPADEEGEVLDAHPPEVIAQMKEIEVVVPDNVKGKWSAVQLAVSADEGSKSELTIPVGGEKDVAEGLVVTVDAFLPDYTSDFEKATSASDSLNNPAALVHVTKGGEVVAKGWVFKNFPEFNTFNSKELKIELVDAKPAE